MITVEKMNFVGSDNRGCTHAFQNDRTGQFLVAHRLAGSKSGGHYHTGKHPYKQPEKLLFVQGEALLHWKTEDGKSGEIKLEAPSCITIPPYFWHLIEAVSDIVFVELNELEAGKNDSFNL